MVTGAPCGSWVLYWWPLPPGRSRGWAPRLHEALGPPKRPTDSEFHGDGTSAGSTAAPRRVAAVGLALTLSLGGLSAARALIKGNAPPEGYGLGKGMNKAALDCRSRAECEELGLKREEEKYGMTSPGQEKTYKLTPSKARYKASDERWKTFLQLVLGLDTSFPIVVVFDSEDVKAGDESAGVAKVGDDVKIRYRVMRSGKRSYDGLSGEAEATLNAPIGQGRFVKALDEALVGMAVGGVRRIQVRPDYGLGWKKEGKCAEAIGAVGMVAGLPAAGAERESDCIDTALLPQPIDRWGAEMGPMSAVESRKQNSRRFERRFDEALIVEAELMGLGK
eukprot:g29650.t1